MDTTLVDAALRELDRQVHINDIPQRRRAPILELRSHLQRAAEQVTQERQTGTIDRPALDCQTCGIRVSQCPECGVHMESGVVQIELPPLFTCSYCIDTFDSEATLAAHVDIIHPQWNRRLYVYPDPTYRDNAWRCSYANREGVRCTRIAHLSGGHRVRPWVCGMCRTDNISDWQEHVNFNHNGREEWTRTPVWVCSEGYCEGASSVCTSLGIWLSHRRYDHVPALSATLTPEEERYGRE